MKTKNMVQYAGTVYDWYLDVYIPLNGYAKDEAHAAELIEQTLDEWNEAVGEQIYILDEFEIYE